MGKITKRHFVFDVDDTITDSYDFNQQLFVDVFKPYMDVAVPEVDKYLRDLHFSCRGISMQAQFKEAIDHFALKLDPSILTKDNENLQIKKIGEVKIFDAVSDVIKTLKNNGAEISVCSNRGRGSLEKVLKKQNLYKYITNIISCVEAGHEKPDPYCLNDVVKKSGLKKKDFIYFGDSKTDYEFASRAGIDFIIVDHYLNNKKFYKLILQSFM
jgi:HAD superfamily hydrolase (TIGR01549 family)